MSGFGFNIFFFHRLYLFDIGRQYGRQPAESRKILKEFHRAECTAPGKRWKMVGNK